ncbi:MAG: hypothetical protein GPJ13_09170 [Microcystis aeruginosa W11-06]|nr:hypothetical protein [Microcystis aeruginosa W11-03]NCR93923.1 hypothetical protein [Microcystis aeruginosa W11-06]
MLVLILAYLWNKNLESLEPDAKERVVKIVEKPTIGQILEICRKLDTKKEILKKKANSLIDSYTELRNQRIGHGYVYQDAIGKLIDHLRNLSLEIESLPISFFNQDIDLVVVSNINDQGTYHGIAYRADGDYDYWNCPQQVHQFFPNDLYGLMNNNTYFRLSPFISLRTEDEYYIFNSIVERLTGKIKYNRINKTGEYFQEYQELCKLYVENDGHRKKGINGTIINVFDNNYKKYIDVGIKAKITEFIIKNKSSVASTVWGHGGVGKTASVQRVCEELTNSSTKYFDYIVFLSAKDRFYDYFTGTVKIIEDEQKTGSFDKLIRNINFILRKEDIYDTDYIYEFEGKLLLIIDDYETFSSDDKEEIENFIKKLNINHHKVIITTRANLIVGYEIQTNELKKDETKQFLTQIRNIEFPTSSVIHEAQLTSKQLDKIQDITSGRPLFIFQFAYIVEQRGLPYALSKDFKSGEDAIKFLYGRIYDYLSKTAQNVFVAMGILTNNSEGDLTNLLEKVKYILNLEHRENEFNMAIKELEKLRI